MREVKLITENNLYRAKWDGGGEMPAYLSGLYTSPKAAYAAIEFYLEKRDGAKNAKNNSRKK